MPAILAIETSAHIGAVALLPDTLQPESAIVEVTRDDSKLSAWVLPAVQRVLALWRGSTGQIDAIAFGAGPGSFTGVRTACATAQSLAYVWQKPLLAVDSLEALAQQAMGDSTQVTVALDARMGEVYAASFLCQRKASGVTVRRLTPTIAQSPSSVVLTGSTLLLGSGAALTAAAQPDALVSVIDSERSRAVDNGWAIGVARVAALMLARGMTVDPLAAEPIYVRNNVAQTEAERLARRRAAPVTTN